MEKVRKYARILLTLYSITFWIVLVVGILLLAGGTFLTFSGKLVVMFEEISAKLPVDLSFMKPILTNQVFIYAALAVGAVSLILSILKLGQLRKAFRETADNSPFAEGTTRALNTAAFMTLLLGLIGLATSVAAYVLFKPEATGDSYTMNLSLTFIFEYFLYKLLAAISANGKEKYD